MENPDRVVAGVDMGDATLAEAIAAELVRAEEMLLGVLSDGEDFLTEVASHLAKAGGKRFRPLFTALAAQMGPTPATVDVTRAAVVVEMIHLATLYHDDVMDEADMRRGVESANARWGNSVAILSGDFLFARASRILAAMGAEAVAVIAETFADLVTGQMRETVGAREADPIEHYMAVIGEKTACLVATAGRFGGMYSGADATQIETLDRLGHAVGMAFQIVDDIIDITSGSEQSGKTPGTDLREGVATLPVLYALREEGPRGDRLRELLDGPVTDDALVEEALGLLRESEGMVRTRETLEGYVESARRELAALPAGPANTAFANLIDYTVARVR